MMRHYLIGLFTVDLNVFIPELTADIPASLYFQSPPVYVSPASSPSP